MSTHNGICRPIAVVLTAGVIALGVSSSAAAQTGAWGSKAMTASGPVTGGVSVDLYAWVGRDTTAGHGCVSLEGYLRRGAAWEVGCGPLTVEMDDLLIAGRVRGTLATSYGTGSSNKGEGTVKLDVTVSGSGAVYPGVPLVLDFHNCNAFFYLGYAPGCYLGKVVDNVRNVAEANPSPAREGEAAGTVVSKTLATSGMSGTGTLYVKRSS